MNSKQRRAVTRKLKHTVTMYMDGQERYFHFDHKVYRAGEWCRFNCRGMWCSTHQYNNSVFKFEEEKEAMLFALLWL